MEKRLLLPVIILLTSLNIFFHSLSQQKNVQLYLWAGLDAYPEIFTEEKQKYPENVPFAYPVQKIKELAPFLLEGMTYGWEFTYVPYDKMRGVSEFFERKSIKSFEPYKKKIIYKKPVIKDGKLCVWIEFERTPEMISYLNFWNSLHHDKIHGKGSASLEKGFDGIQEACDLALKEAVREHFRTQIKNKPKEITGRVLIKNLPKITSVSGKYIVDLDFFVEKDRIIQYTQY